MSWLGGWRARETLSRLVITRETVAMVLGEMADAEPEDTEPGNVVKTGTGTGTDIEGPWHR
ncbi:hypothetical protein [Streptomyces canus]|uniref:hypothetical protein n=1 Tax=Streptomyces canus TaxID=58343 RepID=UPI00037DA9CF|nr:hypothetical protein [Streptomyces canus]